MYMLRRLILLVFSALALAVAGVACALRPLAEWDPDPNALIIQAKFCCGFVPPWVGMSYIPDAQVWGDGRILWVETNADGRRRVLEGRLTFDQMTALMRRIVDDGFFGWEDNYGNTNVPDLASQCLTVNLRYDSKSVCEYGQGAPSVFHALYADVASGAGASGADYAPTTAYLTVYPQDFSGQAAPPLSIQWPTEAAGFTLGEAASGRWVDGAALALAWQAVNVGGLVQEGEAYYALALQIPSVSLADPPSPIPTPGILLVTPCPPELANMCPSTPVPPTFAPYPFPATPELTPFPTEPYPVSFDETQTPVLLAVPTLTPGPLRVWTVMPNAQAESARQFVARQMGLAEDQLELIQFGPVIRPATGEQLWFGSFAGEGRLFAVLVDSGSQASFLDLTERAKDMLAQELNLPVDNMHILGSNAQFFPLTRQVVWATQLRTIWGGSLAYPVILDLDGNRMDMSAMIALSEAEDAMRAVKCPKLDEWSLCPAFAGSPPEAEFDILIVYQSDAGKETIIGRLQQTSYSFQTEPSLHARLPKHFILELVTLEAVQEIWPAPPERSTVLERNLIFTLEEAGGQFTLKATTQRMYECRGFSVSLQAIHSEPQQLDIVIQGFNPPGWCGDNFVAPARGEAALGALEGTYTLRWRYGDLQDVYQVTVTPDAVSVQPEQTQFTWPQYETWQRLPADTIWFVMAQNPELPRDDQARAALAAETSRFFAAVEALGAEPFNPAEGIYSQRLFIPPWPGWLREGQGCTWLRVDIWKDYCVIWPVVRYYHYTGPLEPLRALVQPYTRNSPILLGSYLWTGEPLGQGAYP